MGIIIQPLSVTKTKERTIPDLSPRMNRLFTEFLIRYEKWRMVQKSELEWLIVTLILGLTSLTLWMYPLIYWGIIFSLLLFVGALRRYLKVKEYSNHLYVNVRILHHHFLGKLEVGFCDHQYPCQCAEQFKAYVWKQYGISFYGDKL